MCGRFSLAGDPFELGFKDNFNITPSTAIPVKSIDCDGQLMNWSYSPSWKPDMNLIIPMQNILQAYSMSLDVAY